MSSPLVQGHVYVLTGGKLRCGVYDGESSFIGVYESLKWRHLDRDTAGSVVVGDDLGSIPDGISINETIDPVCVYCTDPVDNSTGRWDHMEDSYCPRVIPVWPRNDDLFQVMEGFEKNL